MDYDNIDDAYTIISKVRDYIGMIKIGLELFSATGFESFSLAHEFDIPIFLDLKLHDIPITVSKTIKVLSDKLSKFNGRHFISIHCSGGKDMCAGAINASNDLIDIVGITNLTSNELNNNIYLLIENSVLNNFVCPPTIVKELKNIFINSNFICPGIRSSEGNSNDHKNVGSPKETILNGAKWLVVGRPITQSKNPTESAKYFWEESLNANKI